MGVGPGFGPVGFEAGAGVADPGELVGEVVKLHLFPDVVGLEAEAEDHEAFGAEGGGGVEEVEDVFLGGEAEDAFVVDGGAVAEFGCEEPHCLCGEFGFAGYDLASEVVPADLARAEELVARASAANVLALEEYGVPVGRFGRPEEIAAAIAFMLSDEAGFITGQTLFVDGGSSIGKALL